MSTAPVIVRIVGSVEPVLEAMDKARAAVAALTDELRSDSE